MLEADGWKILPPIKNKSDNGIDIIGIGPNGQIGFFEVKSTKGKSIPKLSKLQTQGEDYINDILSEVAKKGTLRGQKISNEMRDLAENLINQIKAGTPVSRTTIGVDKTIKYYYQIGEIINVKRKH